MGQWFADSVMNVYVVAILFSERVQSIRRPRRQTVCIARYLVFVYFVGKFGMSDLSSHYLMCRKDFQILKIG